MMYILIVLEYKFFKYNYDTTLIFFFLETLYVKHSVQGKTKNIYKVVYSYELQVSGKYLPACFSPSTAAVLTS